MDVGQSYSVEDLDVLSELRQYFPPGTPDDQMLGMMFIIEPLCFKR